jgi:hypothetical protein
MYSASYVSGHEFAILFVDRKFSHAVSCTEQRQSESNRMQSQFCQQAVFINLFKISG